MTYDGALTDLEAVRAFAASRDSRAFEVLIDRYQRMVLATCLRVLGDRGHAEDATQETFLKLARHASEITSNAGAWLHRCATRTAIDARRSLRVRRDAERVAASEALASHPTERTWREIEPLVDAALERLRDEDRDVLVSRFLLGRAQASMADEAGVNAGTMSRRIDRALKRLYSELDKGGVEIAGIGALGGAMALAARAVMPSGETLVSLGKISLAAGATGTSGAISKTVLILGVGTVAVASVAVGVLMVGGGPGGVPSVQGVAAPALAAQAEPVERPRRAIEKLTMVHHQIAGPMGPTMVCDGRTLEMSLPSWNGETEGMIFRVLDWSASGKAEGKLTLRTQSLDLREASHLEALRGRDFEAEYAIDAYGRLQLVCELVEGDADSRITWTGVAVGGQEGDDGRPFVGEWSELSQWDMRITEDTVEVLSDGYPVYRFRVLDWQERSGATRIASICVDSMAPHLVGKRVKLLLRETDGLYELSFRQWPRERLDEWPEGFLADEDNALNVLAFRRVK